MTTVYAAIEAIVQTDACATTAVCDVLDVCRSAFYAWRDGEPSSRDQREATLTPLIRAVFWKHHRRYGARRIARELTDLGEACSPRIVARILRNQGSEPFNPSRSCPRRPTVSITWVTVRT